MFVNSKKIGEELKITTAIAPVASAGVSSSALVSMGEYTKYFVDVEVGAVTTAGNLVVSIYESTSSSWGGAVATEVTAARTTVSTTTSSAKSVQVEIDGDTLNKQYVGVYVTKAGDTASAISAVVIRAGARYGNM